jgi:acetylornithine/succinyldiaminopimelate/putrescine aminotransferase
MAAEPISFVAKERPMSAAHDPAAHLMNTYGRLPMTVSHGQGVRVLGHGRQMLP